MRALLMGLLAALGVVVTLWTVRTALTTPTVYRAWPSGDCRAVRPAGDCAAPPARYETVWVDPAWEGTR